MFFLIGYTQTKIPEAQRARDPAIPPEGIHLRHHSLPCKYKIIKDRPQQIIQ